MSERYKRYKFLKSEGVNGRPGGKATLECEKCHNNLFRERSSVDLFDVTCWYACKVCGHVAVFSKRLNEATTSEDT
jgi:hypothetical protein